MELTRAAARYRVLGDELRKRREAAGLTCQQLGKRTGWSTSKVSRIEIGRRELDVVDVIHYLGACEIYRGQALDLLAEFREAARCDHAYWLSPYSNRIEDSLNSLVYHEATARVSVSYEPHVVPGLLQTERYARAVLRRFPVGPDDLVEFGLKARMERQSVLHRPVLAHFTFFIHECALRMVVDDPAIMYEQLLALMFLDGLPHVTIRVVPESAEFGGSFRVLQYAQHAPLVYLTSQFVGIFLEDKDHVGGYFELLPYIADAALSERQSRQLVASLSDEYGRRSAHGRVEQS